MFRLLDRLWPKDDNLLVFTGGIDVGYSDNSRFLFERFLENYGGKFEMYWVTPRDDLFNDVAIMDRARERMLSMHSLKGVVALLRARTVFFSWGFSDLPVMDFSLRTVTIQLWHGIPIKKIGLCSKRMPTKVPPSVGRRWHGFTYWVTSSSLERDSISKCTGLPLERVKVTGYPRNDYLIENRASTDTSLSSRFPFLRKTVILYAPTYRAHERVRFFPFGDFQPEKLIAFLEENDAYLVLRTHHVDDVLAGHDEVDYDSFLSDRIVVMNRDSVRDVQELLPHVDIMVSDYSGVWLDFLLLNRPVVFVPYDLESFEAREGLLYDYQSITPGPKVSEFGELLKVLNDYVLDPSKDSEARGKIKRLFHEFEDGKAYDRIYRLVRGELR
jgi:CDP-glycerol glycerophosphotransferase (TagB/SpsB family)